MSVKTNGERLLELARDLSCGLMEADEQRELGRLLYDAALWTGNPLRKLSPAGALCDTQTVDRALAASQPVGEPVAWMTHHDEPMLFPTAAEAAAYCEDDEQPVPLFRSPAQAVDLGQFVPDPKTVPDCFAEDDSDAQYNSGWNDCRDAVLALIDKAVQP